MNISNMYRDRTMDMVIPIEIKQDTTDRKWGKEIEC